MKWDSKKRGHIYSAPPRANNMAVKAIMRGEFGKVWKTTSRDKDGNEIILKNFPGMYQKTIYNPTKESYVEYPINAAEIVFGAVEFKTEIQDVAVNQIAELEKLRVHFTYLKNTFIPEMEEALRELIGKGYAVIFSGGFPLIYKVEESWVDNYMEYWNDWTESVLGPEENEGYDTWMDYIDDMQDNWDMLTNASNPSSDIELWIYPNLYPIDGASLWIDCERRLPIPEFENESSEDSHYISTQKKAQYASEIYESIDTDEVRFFICYYLYGFLAAYFDVTVKGVIEITNNNLYLIGKDPDIYVRGLSGWPTTIQIVCDMDIRDETTEIFSGPSEIPYMAGRYKRLVLDYPQPVIFKVSVKGRVPEVPDNFGVHIEKAEFEGNLITRFPRIVIDSEYHDSFYLQYMQRTEEKWTLWI